MSLWPRVVKPKTFAYYIDRTQWSVHLPQIKCIYIASTNSKIHQCKLQACSWFARNHWRLWYKVAWRRIRTTGRISVMAGKVGRRYKPVKQCFSCINPVSRSLPQHKISPSNPCNLACHYSIGWKNVFYAAPAKDVATFNNGWATSYWPGAACFMQRHNINPRGCCWMFLWS